LVRHIPKEYSRTRVTGGLPERYKLCNLLTLGHLCAAAPYAAIVARALGVPAAAGTDHGRARSRTGDAHGGMIRVKGRGKQIG
jgi:signal transduction protein with GAF and PtsI domain